MMPVSVPRLSIWLAGAMVCGLWLWAMPARPAEPVCPPVASAPTAEAMSAALRTARDRGALWTIEKDGRRSWLYGTIHIGSLEMSVPGPKVAEALRAADTIAVEVDVTDPATMHAIQAADPDGARAIPAALLDRLKEQARRACIPWERLAGMPPVLAAVSLTALDGRWAGLDPGYAIEFVLISLARSTGKPVRALETAAAQRAILVAGTPEHQVRTVEEAMTALEQNRARAALATLARAWSEGDLATIAAYDRWCLCAATAEDRADFEHMVFDRNPGLAAAIDALHREGRRAFAGAGILHMVGERGLPALLEKMGYRVERVRFDGS